ncbi:MAG: B12-binding domain-containing radical SAM protein [Acidobacteria bacterium]|nr:MAG: B12-binding domain-containing radical SAM protein [Acidobacteriota bacterium]
MQSELRREGLSMTIKSSSCDDHTAAFPPLGKGIKALMVWPDFPGSFWSFAGMMEMLDEKVVMPPLGLVTVAALCPKDWTIRLIDQQVDEVSDDDILWADLVMVSGMRVQRKGLEEILARARRLGRRTIVGGPYASGEPEVLLELADHVVAGEPDEVFDEIARDLENGTAKRLYTIEEKPDVTQTPVPRFDLLNLDYYASMSIQFSRGCPFQCEFCDIIILYGRKPRAKRPEQVLTELDTLLNLGWKKQVFIVDDNFIGNHKLALGLSVELEKWQRAHGFPLAFYTEASMDLAQRPALIEAMVKANFFYVFVGIESPVKESLTETKKYQNLRLDPVECIEILHKGGLWVTGGFIVGFDSDPEDIFDQQIRYIEDAAIPWAILNFLHAVPLTPLHDRMKKEGRLIEYSVNSSDSTTSNFRTMIPLESLVRGYQKTLAAIYDPAKFYERSWRSLQSWQTKDCQRPAQQPALASIIRITLRSFWRQGLRSSYRRAYWKFFFQLVSRYLFNPPKLWLGFTMMISGHHFIPYSQEVVREVEKSIPAPVKAPSLEMSVQVE